MTWGGAGVPGNGDTATLNHAVSVDVNTTVGTSPSDQTTLVLTVSNGITLTVASGVTLKLRGNANSGGNSGGGLTIQAGAVLEFDASQATTTTTTYKWDLGRNFINTSSFTTAGTSGSHVTVRSNAGGGHGYFAAGNGPVAVNLTYTDFQSIGDSTNNSLSLGGASTSTDVMTNVTFDANCGRVEYTVAAPAGAGWDFEDCYFDQTNAKSNVATGHNNSLILRVANAASTATRRLYRCRFQKAPFLVGPGLDVQDCLFSEGWDDNSGGWAFKWANFSGGLTRLTTNSGQIHSGDIGNHFVLFDSGAATDTGTSSGSNTSTTLNDTTKSWTTNTFQPGGSSKFYFVEITGGTGVGQRRGIWTNTGTQLTITYRWDATPDATSTYSIVADIPNNHGLLPESTLTSGSVTWNGVVFQNAGCDTQGDCLLHLDQTGVTFTISNCLTLPNGMGDNSGTLVTLGNTDNGTINVMHCTAFTGAQAAVSLSEGGVGNAGQLDVLKGNIGWCDPNRTPASPNQTTDHTKYWANGGCYGPYMAVDTNHPSDPQNGTQDLMVAGAGDYNCAYGHLTGFAGKGYNLNCSVAPGSHDQDGNPRFVDSTRSFWKWAASRGSTATTITGQIADGLSYLRADPTLARLSLLPYIQAGFAPRSSSVKCAAHDGTTIGAVTYSPATSARHLYRRNLNRGA